MGKCKRLLLAPGTKKIYILKEGDEEPIVTIEEGVDTPVKVADGYTVVVQPGPQDEPCACVTAEGASPS